MLLFLLQVVHQCTGELDFASKEPRLPLDKPRYLMGLSLFTFVLGGLELNDLIYLAGVGYPVDLVVCVALGVDMFDCVWPCKVDSACRKYSVSLLSYFFQVGPRDSALQLCHFTRGF